MCVTVTFVQTAPHYFFSPPGFPHFLFTDALSNLKSLVFLLGAFLNSMQVD